MAPPTARGSPIAVAPAPPRTVAWRGVPRAAISTRWGQWCAAQRHSNATQRWGQPCRSRGARRHSHWRSGALRQPGTSGTKDPQVKPETCFLSNPSRLSRRRRLCWCACLRPSNLQRNQRLQHCARTQRTPHAASRGPKSPRATRINNLLLAPKRSRPQARRRGATAPQSSRSPRTAARGLARTLGGSRRVNRRARTLDHTTHQRGAPHTTPTPKRHGPPPPPQTNPKNHGRRGRDLRLLG